MLAQLWINEILQFLSNFTMSRSGDFLQIFLKLYGFEHTAATQQSALSAALHPGTLA